MDARTAVVVVAHQADGEVVDRLNDELAKHDIASGTWDPDSAFASTPDPEVARVVIALFSRASTGSEWFTAVTTSARQSGTLLAVTIVDPSELPPDMRDLAVLDLTHWREGRDNRAVSQLVEAVRERLEEPDFPTPESSLSVDVDDASASTPVERPRQSMSAFPVLRPAARELLQVAHAIAAARGTSEPAATDVVLAALYRPSQTALDPVALSEGATSAMLRAVPEPRSRHVDDALSAAGVDLERLRATADMGSDTSIADSFVDLVERASEIVMDVAPAPAETSKQATPHVPAIWSHHLVAAALTAAPLAPSIEDALGVEQSALIDALRSGIASRWTEEQASVWTQILVTPPSPREDGEPFPEFHHDDTRGRDLLAEDRLDIAPHDRPFALLIASKELRPPLAAGLFGDWGSGKSYFMRALRQEVDRLTKQARDSRLPQHELPVYRNVAQIEFNAWHFVDADLWASLADFIFSNLRIDEGEAPDDVNRRRTLYVEQLKKQGAAIRQIETERRHLEDQIDLSEHELRQVRAEKQRQLDLEAQARAAIRATPEIKEAVDDLTQRLRLRSVGEEVGDLQAALRDARDVAGRANATAGLLGGRYGNGWFVAALIALFLGPVVLFISYHWDFDAVERAAATAAGFLAGAAALVRTASAAAKSTLDTVDRLDEELQEQVEADADVTVRAEALKKLNTRATELAAEEAALHGQLAEVQKALRELTPGKLLADFILSRRDTDDYRKHLGLASMIRRDFEALAHHIDAFNTSLELPSAMDDGSQAPLEPQEAGEGKKREGPSEDRYHVNRIVLYIDDLDRCPPETVVKVLQAVHLLLAFPLFVVVVGVDARWLSRSLEKHYEGLLGSGDDGHDVLSATPHDYLEKIFQIPFWLRPMPLDATERMLTALTKLDHEGPSADPGGEVPDEVDAGSPQRRETPVDARDDNETDTTTTTAQPPAASTAETSTVPADGDDHTPLETVAYDLRALPVTITQDERDFMHELSPILGRSPRSLTRFVNVFRLLKAVQRNERRRMSSDGDADQVAMLLLAIVTGLPDISRPFFTELSVAPRRPEPAETEVADVVERARSRSTAEDQHRWSPVEEQQWALLEEWLELHETWARTKVSTWSDRAERVARYSYRIESIEGGGTPDGPEKAH